jgi:hypothetical protein
MNKGEKMRDPKRIDKILEMLGTLWKEHPDQRFFQLCVNFTPLVYYKTQDPWFYEDDELFKALEYQVKQITKDNKKKTKERC